MFDSLKNFFGGKKQPDGSEALICTQNSGHIDYR